MPFQNVSPVDDISISVPVAQSLPHMYGIMVTNYPPYVMYGIMVTDLAASVSRSIVIGDIFPLELPLEVCSIEKNINSIGYCNFAHSERNQFITDAEDSNISNRVL